MSKNYLVDILILHGKDKELVDDLIEFLSSLGYSANNVLGLPSNSLPQYDRVNYAIKNSGLNIILASFDEEEKNTEKARTNVYDELRYSVEKRPKETIVLREKRNTTRVDLPTNLDGKCIIIEFNREKLHKSYPALISEIKSRLTIDSSGGVDKKLKTGSILNMFLDTMDRIWEDEFDIASYNIVKDDWTTENNFQDMLDKFFQKYWEVFDALIRRKANNEQLMKIINESINESYKLAAQVWSHVSEGNMKAVDERVSKKEKDRKFNTDEVTQRRDEAYHIIRAIRNVNDSKEKIAGFRKAVTLLKDCLK